MSDRKEAFEKAIKLLNELSHELTEKIASAKSHFPPLEKMTEEIARNVVTCMKNRSVCQSYLKDWFRAFLGIKDEAMILITGELVRGYHIPIHGKYQHQRIGESHYYNDGCTLSACSVDGLDYEYRTMHEKFGSRQSLDCLADTTQRCSEELNALTKNIDLLGSIIKRALLSVGVTVKMDLRHCGEILEAQFHNPEYFIQLKGAGSLRKCSRNQALRTVVEDVVDEQPNLLYRNPQFSSSKTVKKRLLDDSDEEGDIVEVSRVHKQPDFGFSASIEDIKRAHSLITPLVHRVEPEQSLSRTVGSAKIQLNYSHGEGAVGIPEWMNRRIRFKVLNPYPESIFACAKKEYIPHVIVSINLLHPKFDPEKKVIFVSSYDIIEEITKVLWQSPIITSQKMEWFHLRLWFPKSVQVEGYHYSKDMQRWIPIPTADKTKLYPVICENHDIVVDFCQQLSTYCCENGPLDDLHRKVVTLKRVMILAENTAQLANYTHVLLKRLAKATPERIIEVKLFNYTNQVDRELANQLQRFTFSFLSNRYLPVLLRLGVRPVIATITPRQDGNYINWETRFWYLCEWFPVVVLSNQVVSTRMIRDSTPSELGELLLQKLTIANSQLYLDHGSHFTFWLPFCNQYFPTNTVVTNLWLCGKEDTLSDEILAQINWESFVDLLIDFLRDKRDPLLNILEKLFIHATRLTEIELTGCVRNMVDGLMIICALVNSLRVKSKLGSVPANIKVVMKGFERLWTSLSRVLRNIVFKEHLLSSNEQLIFDGDLLCEGSTVSLLKRI